MGRQKNRYQKMERTVTCGLIADAVLFLLYLVFAGIGVIWLKVLLAVMILLICSLILTFLYLSKELLRPRSLWMSVAAASILVCTLFSLLLRFPSPKVL